MPDKLLERLVKLGTEYPGLRLELTLRAGGSTIEGMIISALNSVEG
jgi:hypothetical protein